MIPRGGNWDLDLLGVFYYFLIWTVSRTRGENASGS